jgi:uncharacterized protein
MCDDAHSPTGKMRVALTSFSPSWEMVVELACAHGKEVTSVVAGPDDDTALHFAAYWGEDSAIVALLAADADVNSRNRVGATPVHLAAMNGKCETIKLLVKHGASLSLFDLEGNTPLHTACSAGVENAVDTLLSCGADPTARNSINGNTPCHVAAREGFSGICTLLATKGDPREVLAAHNDAEEQPLHRAAAYGQRHVVRSLIALGADVCAVDANGDEALHLAAMFGMSETVEELIAAGVKLDVQDDDKQTPLHLACSFKQESTACALIRSGADWKLNNEEGLSSMEVASANSMQDVLDCINGLTVNDLA